MFWKTDIPMDESIKQMVLNDKIDEHKLLLYALKHADKEIRDMMAHKSAGSTVVLNLNKLAIDYYETKLVLENRRHE
jgi:hypothetical protein